MELERYIIENCAPTLASIKPANLFSFRYTCEKSVREQMAVLNRRFAKKGITLKFLKKNKNTVLVYVYRKDLITKDLNNALSKKILQKYGYDDLNVEQSLGRLVKRINSTEEFPHEIGLFLGYPPKDVEGFICNGGKNCNLCGYWKVYGNVDEALTKFAQYDKCKAIYKQLWASGRDILQMTVLKRAKIA